MSKNSWLSNVCTRDAERSFMNDEIAKDWLTIAITQSITAQMPKDTMCASLRHQLLWQNIFDGLGIDVILL